MGQGGDLECCDSGTAPGGPLQHPRGCAHTCGAARASRRQAPRSGTASSHSDSLLPPPARCLRSSPRQPKTCSSRGPGRGYPPPEPAPRPLVPFVLRPAVEIRVLCAYSPFCIIISLSNFPLFFIIIIFFYYCLLPGEGLKPDFRAPCLPALRSAHLPGIIISTLIFI